MFPLNAGVCVALIQVSEVSVREERQHKDVCYLAAEPHSFSIINGGGGAAADVRRRMKEMRSLLLL